MRTATNLLVFLLSIVAASAQEATITVHTDRVTTRISRYLTGACIEDVNHEIYGGLYSQMIFGESFQEPAHAAPIKDWTSYGGDWRASGGEVRVSTGEGPKLISKLPPFTEGKASIELFFADRSAGNAGLILKVSTLGVGADWFVGYEVSLDAQRNMLVLGRHRQNWEPLREIPCQVATGQWIRLQVSTKAASIAVEVDGQKVIEYADIAHPLQPGAVGLRAWQREARFRNASVTINGKNQTLPLEAVSDALDQVSGIWRAVKRGSAQGGLTIETNSPFVGCQSQRISFTGGEGELGIENQSLNRWGMNFVAGKDYEGELWARSDENAELFVAMEDKDGAKAYCEKKLKLKAGSWEKLAFMLKPNANDKAGRFVIKLKQPGSVAIGHAFLQPGKWGRFKNLPVRRDVAEALIDQGITVLRYGGSMVNAPEYRWKKMIGPRDRRPPYRGTWYPFSSNGWGIPDFLNFCEAAGFLAIPAFNADETPQDMADFVRYANAPANSEWGRRRAADGHTKPYRLKHLEFGNEEKIDEHYWQRFAAVAKAVWAADPAIILVVGDFAYSKVITDPFKFEGGAVINTLAAHKKILDLAKENGREVWFDIHIGTEQPPDPRGLQPEQSYIEQLDRLSPGAKHKVVIFEFNANNHSMKRALANACAINQVERLGSQIPIACSANCLQPDGQNDNGWNQGLLFLNPSQVWLQPPGFVTQMISRNYQPNLLEVETTGAGADLDISAKKSDNGRKITLQVVNTSNRPIPARITLPRFVPRHSTGAVLQIAGQPDASHTAANPRAVVSERRQWIYGSQHGDINYTFHAYSFTVFSLE